MNTGKLRASYFYLSLFIIGLLTLCLMVLARIIVTVGATRDPNAASELVDPRP